MPVQFNDLPRTAQLALTIYDCFGPDKLGPVGGTTISLFSKHGLFRQVLEIGYIYVVHAVSLNVLLGYVRSKSMA